MSTIELSGREKAGVFLLEQMMEYCYSAALRAAAAIGIADHLVEKPKTAAELARDTNTDEGKLYRVLRLLASRGVFRLSDKGQFELTPSAEYLCSKRPQSLRAGIMMLGDDTFWKPLADLAEIVKSADENPVFQRLFGGTFFEYWAKHPQSLTHFHVGMSSMSSFENQLLVRAYEFPKGATVVDVAGNKGDVLLQVMQENPTTRGVLFDQEHIVPSHRLNELGDDTRWETVAGNYFESIPAGDVYVLKYILHDNSDTDCVRILRNIRKAIRPGGRVIIMDPVIPEENVEHPGKLMDMLVMAIYAVGQERSEPHFRRLLSEAGFGLTRVVDTGFYVSIVEAVPD
ncbi:methyltransferase [Burkholderia sp. BCC1988]|uniref:methyltransferase n=1 Tax=Burkholderia sp. BCC1988 TaxID=2817443 RepID=UPI002AB24F63|nr:methyltransferase [Burkholderia sp. BCC1988]